VIERKDTLVSPDMVMTLLCKKIEELNRHKTLATLNNCKEIAEKALGEMQNSRKQPGLGG